MKTGGKTLLKLASTTLLAVMLIFGMVPFYDLPGWTGLNGKAYAAVPADGTGWTASGTDGLKYFQNIYGTGNQITSLSYGATLSTGVYYIMNSITLTPTSSNLRLRTNALNINGNVKLILLNNSTLTVTGGRAIGYQETYTENGSNKTNTNTGGAGAGISLPSGSTLTVDGQGTIKASGGAAGKGQDGQQPDGSKSSSSDSYGYKGGKGGYGGGGAGAGIGTAGGKGNDSPGNGGAGGAGDGSGSGSGGGNGGAGSSSANSGTLFQYGNVTITATGGAGANGGVGGESRWESSGYRNAHGGGGGAGGGWYDSYYARGGKAGGYSTSKGSSNTNGKAGNDGNNYGGSVFSYGSGGASQSASSATGGKGGNGGSSGSYGTSGAIYGTKISTSAYSAYRITANGKECGGRNSTYMIAPLREIKISLVENSTAKLNDDGSYLYQNGTAVKPTVKIVHVPTGATLTEATYTNTGEVNAYNSFYTAYSSNVGAQPTNGNPVNASVAPYSNGLKANQGHRQIVTNVIGSQPGTPTLETLSYNIDYATYKVTQDAAGGIGSRTVSVKVGAPFTWGPDFRGEYQTAPTREGYVFEGFYSEKNGQGTKYFESVVQSDGSAQANPITKWSQNANGTIYANWTPLTYKIRFWSDYGDGSEYVEYNQSDAVYEKAGDETSAKLKPATYGNLVLPSAHDLGISRDHYDFVGWNIYEEQDWAMYKAGKTYKAGLTTKQDDIVNIYAAWRAKDQLVVSYDANGGTGAPPSDGTWADADFTLSSQTPVRDGYTFKGWNTAASPEYDEETGKQTNGVAYESGETVSAEDLERAIVTSVTMYAQWERNPSVSYRANGGALETSIPTQYPTAHSEVTIDYSPISRTGYDFVGWNVRDTDQVYVEDTPESATKTIDGKEYHLNKASTFNMPETSVVLEALWEPQQMDVDYVKNLLYDYDGWYYADAEGNKLLSLNDTVEYDNSLDFQVVIDRDKVDDSGLRLRINDINTTPAEVVDDDTNTATYKYHVDKVRGGLMIQTAGLVGQTYPVVLDTDDGALRGAVSGHTFGEETQLPITEDSVDQETGDTIEGNTPVKQGFAFEGWYSSEDENGDPTGDAVTVISPTAVPTSEDGTITLHAKWKTSTYNIAFDVGALPGEDGSVLQWQDGEGAASYKEAVSENDDFKNVKYSAVKTLPDLANYVKYEYGEPKEDGTGLNEVEAKFLGWSTKKSAAEPEYSPGHVVKKLTDKDGATVTLYPVWGAPHFKLVLDANGGKITDSITGYQAGESIDLTEVKPARAGYEFGGWYESKFADDSDVTGETKITSIPAESFGDKTYYAYWTAKEYKYTLQGIDLSTGEDTSDSWQPADKLKVGQKAKLDLPVKKEDDPETTVVDETEYYITPPAGKVLAGWTDAYEANEEGTGYTYSNVLFDAGETTSDLWIDNGEIEGRTLYPVWKNDGDETLVFDANGGEEGPEVIEASRGTAISIGFDNENSNVNLSYTVAGEDPANVEIEAGYPKKVGYIFAGYDSDKTKAYDSADLEYPASATDEKTITLSASKRLYAIWQPISYEITYDAALGDETGDVGFNIDDEWQPTMKQTVTSYDEEVALAPQTPTKGSMYEFLGWSTVANGAVEYQAGSIVSQFADEVKDEETGKVTGLKGKTLYAIWLVNDPAYLSFDANGGIGAPAMETHPQGETVSVKTSEKRAKPTYHGYTFDGWATASTDKQTGETVYTKVDEVTMPNSVANTTLYAQWKKNEGIKMSYDGGAGSTGSVPADPTTYYQGETVEILYRPAPSKTGYEFIGWDVVDKNGNVLKELRKERTVGEGDEAQVVEDATLELTDEIFDAGKEDGNLLTLKAVYKANKYTVSFDDNGAKSGDVPASITKTYDDGDVAIPAANGEEDGDGSLVAPTGFSFAGWNLEADGSGTMIPAGKVNWEFSTAADDEVTLYAIWEAGESTVTFDNGDSQSYDKTFAYGQVLPDSLSAPEKTGYDFKYYYIEMYAHDDEGNYLDASGNIVDEKDDAAVEKIKFYDESMEPQHKWNLTSEDLKFQVDGGSKFHMNGEWEAQSFTISYHDQNGVLVSSQDVTYDKAFRVADDADLNVPAGYRHIGWSFKNGAEDVDAGMESGAVVTPTAANKLYNNGQSVSVYAVFQEIKKFTVNYDANGGTDAPQDTTQYEDGEYADVQFDPIPTRANYDFLGWTTYSNTSSVLPGGANESKYYGSVDLGCKSFDGYAYHYGEDGGSNTDKGDIQIKMKKDIKLYAVWLQKTYYTVDFYGNSTSNGGAEKSVTTKAATFTGPDQRTYTASSSNDGYKTDEEIYRSTSQYNYQSKSPKITLPDGSQMFNNTDTEAKFMGWAKTSDAKVADHEAGETLEDITMDENVVLNAVWAHPVKNVTLKNIEEPVYEGTPSEDIEATSQSGVTVSKSNWTPSEDTFASGTDYKLTVKMKAADGYYFNSEKLPAVKMNMKNSEGAAETIEVDSDNVSLNAEGDILTAYYVFSTTENIVVNGDKDMQKTTPVAVTGVEAPEAGKKLKTVGTAGDSRVNQAHWFPAVTWTATDAEGNAKEVKATAEPDTIYTSTLRIEPAKGYEFSEEVTKVTFSGETVTTKVDEETGELIVSYTFPKTAAIDNAINLKLSGSLRNSQNLPDQTFTSADNVDKDSRLATVDWYKKEKDGSLTKVDIEKAKVAPSTTYVAQVTLKPADGFAFTAGETTVTFGGDEMTVLASTVDHEGNNFAQLQEDGSIKVSYEFTSSVDVLQEIVAPSSVSTEFGTKVSQVEDLPREVQIITENGKANVDVTWVNDDKVIVITEEGAGEATDAAALNASREAHAVKIQGAVAIPEGVTIPEGMSPTVDLTVKVAADPRLAVEDQAFDLAEMAEDVVNKTPADADNVTLGKKDALIEALNDMTDYIDTWDDAENRSTVGGIQEEMEKVRAAMYELMDALEPIPVLPVKKLGDIAVGEKLPTQALSTDARVHDDSKPADISWTNTNKDTRVEEGMTYEAHIVFKPAYEGAFREGGIVVFDDNVQIEIQGAANTDNNRAWIDSEGKLHLIRTITADKINLVSIDDSQALNAEFGDDIASVGLPKTVNANTDAGDRALTVNWNTEGINLGDTSKRKAHEVRVPGKAVIPDSILNPEEVSEDVEQVIYVAADPRLAPESKAEKLASDAQDAIKAAEAAEIAEEEVQALKDALKNMDDYVKDLDNSTVKGINDEIAKVQDALDALNSFMEHNTVIEMTLFGTDEKDDYKLDYGDKISTSYNLVTATDKDNSVKTTAVKTKWKTDDVNVKSATDYLVEVTLQAAEGAQFNVNRKINFDEVEILMSDKAPEEGATEYATISGDKKSVVVARTYSSKEAKFKEANTIAPVSTAYGTEPGALNMPATVGIVTDDNNRSYEAEIEWDLTPYEEDYANRENNKDAHEVVVKGKLKAVDGVAGAEGVEVTAKIKVGKDPVKAKEDAEKKAAEDARKKAAEEARANTVNESAGIRPGSNIAAVDKFLMKRASDSDPKGSKVAPLKLKSSKQTKKSITLKYKKVKGATRYVIYGNQCGKAKKLKKLKTTKSLKFNVKKIKGKKLKKGKYHKFIVVAIDRNNKVIATSKIVHVATKGGKVGNHKSVTTKAKKNKVSIKTGKTFKLKAKAIPASKKLKVKKHRAVIYESSNARVATVSQKGVIRGKAKETCYVSAYAQNGVVKTVKVTVR